MTQGCIYKFHAALRKSEEYRVAFDAQWRRCVQRHSRQTTNEIACQSPVIQHQTLAHIADAIYMDELHHDSAISGGKQRLAKMRIRARISNLRNVIGEIRLSTFPQISVCSAISSTSSTSIPKYHTVLSNLLCPSSS